MTAGDPAQPGTVLLIGGGTGGHIYPLLAIAEHLRDLVPSAHLVAVCSDRAIDAKVLQPALDRGEVDQVVPIPARPLSLRPGGLFRLGRSWRPCVSTVAKTIEAFPAPVAAVSTGGFVSMPACHACRGAGVPVSLVALDTPPGKATRWLARRTATRFNASPADLHRWTRVGPLVRRAARPIGTPADARAALGLDPDRRTLVIMGGSQGARTINGFIDAFMHAHGQRLAADHWQVLHQTGADAHAELEVAAREWGVSARVVPFLDPIGRAWAAADLVLARAGAGTVSEATLAGVPCVFMPYPFHVDRHQARNAEPLVSMGQASVLDDRIDPAANLAAHAETLLGILLNAASGHDQSTENRVAPISGDGGLLIARHLTATQSKIE
ncbi:MAG: UDP-N-acetylglucosamine--N-acetylmuramyl-(pentapeptide) pyrophosphoryl-undecaprenol N-acetylglucosamine transferase [Planctomycetota bacterium]